MAISDDSGTPRHDNRFASGGVIPGAGSEDTPHPLPTGDYGDALIYAFLGFDPAYGPDKSVKATFNRGGRAAIKAEETAAVTEYKEPTEREEEPPLVRRIRVRRGPPPIVTAEAVAAPTGRTTPITVTIRNPERVNPDIFIGAGRGGRYPTGVAAPMEPVGGAIQAFSASLSRLSGALGGIPEGEVPPSRSTSRRTGEAEVAIERDIRTLSYRIGLRVFRSTPYDSMVYREVTDMELRAHATEEGDVPTEFIGEIIDDLVREVTIHITSILRGGVAQSLAANSNLERMMRRP